VPLIGLGQGCDYGGDLEDAMELCNLMNQEFSFSTNKDADQALERILSGTGLAKNFILMPCDNVNNASAINYKGIRYILYNKDFMKLIVDNTDSWSNLSILAHEIGHHLNAHTIGTEESPTLSQRRNWELEADEFSGFIMFKIGATLEEAQEAVNLVCTNDDDTYSTHPKLDKRLKAIEEGYLNAKNMSASAEKEIEVLYLETVGENGPKREETCATYKIKVATGPCEEIPGKGNHKGDIILPKFCYEDGGNLPFPESKKRELYGLVQVFLKYPCMVMKIRIHAKTDAKQEEINQVKKEVKAMISYFKSKGVEDWRINPDNF